MLEHDPSCRYPVGPPCRRFSTDGTRLGAAIAHTMGTTSEEEIIDNGTGLPFESDIEAEQRDWESDEWES